MRQDVRFHLFQRFQIARRQPTHRINVIKVQQPDTEGSSHVLKNLDRVSRRLILDQLALREALLVDFRVRVGHRLLSLVLSGRPDQLRGQPIDGTSAGVVALEGVAVGDPRQLADADASTPLPRQPVLLVLAVHHLVRKAALEEVKVERVHRNQLGQQHGLERLLTLQTIAKHEAGSLTGMRMQIDIKADLPIVNLLLDGRLDRPDGRLLLLTRINVVPIQILRQRVQPIIPPVHPVRVQHRHHLEAEALAEDPRLLALLISQELPDAIKHERRRRLTRVHPRRNENSRFIKPKRPCTRVTLGIGKQTTLNKRLSFLQHLVFR